MLRPALVFCIVGPLIGAVAFDAIHLSLGAASGRPVSFELDDLGATLWFGWMFGFLPALLTGGLLTRWYTPSTLPFLVVKSAAIGAVVSLVFFGALFGVLLFGPEVIDGRFYKWLAPYAVAGAWRP